MRIQLAKTTRQLLVEKKVQWPGVLVFESFPEGVMISEHARIRVLTLCVRNECAGNTLEMAKSGVNLVSDRNVVFPQNLGCALADFYGHYSSQDLQSCTPKPATQIGGGCGCGPANQWRVCCELGMLPWSPVVTGLASHRHF